MSDKPMTRKSVIQITTVTCTIYFALAAVCLLHFMHPFIPKIGGMTSIWGALVFAFAGFYSAFQSFLLIKNKRVQ